MSPLFPIPFLNRSVSRRSQSRSRRRLKVMLLSGMESVLLEDRTLMTIAPGQVYQYATYTDSDGDKVEISVTGTVTDPLTQGFTVELAGLATDNADATTVNLLGLSATNGVQVVVTPQIQPNAGPNFNNIYSAGYTNVAFLTAEPSVSSPTPMTNLGGIQLSAAIVNSIQLAGISIGNISLDAGQAPYIDRINTTNNQQSLDSTMYNPVTGLIDLGGISAANIDSLVINGAISAPTAHPYDTSVTNDFKSVINVSGRIGSIVGIRSVMGAIVKADSIGSVRVAAISGEIITKNASEPFYINMPTNFVGFIDVAGHLNIGFPMSSGALITGQITAGGGISGVDRTSTTDTIYIPDAFANSLTNTSTVVGIADIAIDGIGMLGLNSYSSVGHVSANEFTETFVVEAATSIGNIDASSGLISGHLQAGTNIGNLKAVGGINGTMIAGGNIGNFTIVNGSMESLSIQAGGNIGSMYLYLGMLGTSIVAGGDLGPISIPVDGISLSFLRAANVSDINVVDGRISGTSIVSQGNVGKVSAFGSITQFGISDVSIVAEGNIAAITGKSHTGYGIELLKLEAGGNIESVTGVSYGEFGALSGAGISQSNFVADNIGPVYGRGAGAVGIEDTNIITRTKMALDGTIDRSSGRIESITGNGWLDGLSNVVAVAHTDISSITGTSLVDGNGIFGGSFDANYGRMGQVLAEGGAGPNAGDGISGTRFQSTDKTFGGIDGITASSNANGLDAMYNTLVYAAEVGPVVAVVHGGLNGNGINGGEIRAYWGDIERIKVNVRSINGMGIMSTVVRASLNIGEINVVAFNNAAISAGDFQARGNFGPIYAESTKLGNAIENSTFSAPGRTFFSPDDPNTEPYGNFGTITAVAAGSNITDSAIVNSTFTAIGDMGQITAKSRGAYGISGSTFTADSDGDYDPAGTTPGSATGNIAGITVVAAGRNLMSSSGIVLSTFSAANIGSINVDVQTVEGGDAISDSTFTATTSIYDGLGNYNNTGTIGDITVKNAADQAATGAGILRSTFNAGAAGGIGNITVTTQSGSGISTSTFDVSLLGRDLDQGLYSGTIGNITVNSGRNANWTLLPAGILLSTFTAAAGIGNIYVNSVGSGITGSIFTADFDWTLNNNVEGNIGNITVLVPGRNASGVTGSAFFASNIGNVTVRLADNAEQGINAVALSNFTAWAGTIGNINIVHSQTGFLYNVGLGYAVLTSVFTAATGIGSINIQGRTLGAVFIVNGTPVRVASVNFVGPKAATVSPTYSIGQVTLISPDSSEITLDATGGVGPLSVSGMPAGSTLTLNQNASNTGDINIVGAGSALPNLVLTTQASSLGNINAPGGLTLNATSLTNAGNINVGGSASLNMPSISTMGNLVVGGTLTLGSDFSRLYQVGQFKAGSLSALKKNLMIGSKSNTGSSIGPIQIGSIAKGKGQYQFTFSTYQGNPNATIGGRSGNARTGQGTSLNGARLILIPGLNSTSVKVKKATAPKAVARRVSRVR